MIFVYRYFNKTDQLLYVGITDDMSRRASQHQRTAEWWSDVARVSVNEHADEKSARAEERKAIALEFPRHNAHGTKLSTEYVTTAIHIRNDLYNRLRKIASERVVGRSRPSVSALIVQMLDEHLHEYEAAKDAA